jgi:N-terminal helicase PWI domain
LSALQEIRRDAFWLQRRVSSAFGSMDAAEAQQLAEKIFRTLEVEFQYSRSLHVLEAASGATSGWLYVSAAAGACLSMQSSTCLLSEVFRICMSRTGGDHNVLTPR